MLAFDTAIASYCASTAVVSGTDNLLVIVEIFTIRFIGTNHACIFFKTQYPTHAYVVGSVKYSNKVITLFTKAFLSWH
jgi:hypothetical protein